MNNKYGTLYLVPTPIGNLDDITLRALKILKSVNLIGAEDTRNSGYLLKHFEISTPMISYHKYNEKKRSNEIISRLKLGEDIAIISDAGSPGISDPSNILVMHAVENGIRVEALPGATAIIPALTASGISSNRFYFAGFLPDKKKDMENLLDSLKEIKDPLVFYVSPHDLYSFAKTILSFFGDRKIVLARELTKLHEEYIRTTLSELLTNRSITLKGEFAVIVSGKEESSISEDEVKSLITKLQSRNLSNREIIDKLVSDYNLKPNRIKDLLY